MPINSKRKGKRGELEWSKYLTKLGFPARRGQQFKGTAESPDVECDSLPLIHWEVKLVKRWTWGELDAWLKRATVEGRGKIACVAVRANRSDWHLAWYLFDDGLAVTTSGAERIQSVLTAISTQRF